MIPAMVLKTIVFVLIAAVSAFALIGPQRVWQQFGPADQGEVNFATLQRNGTPNDALACLPRFCAAQPDVPAPVIALAPPEVFRAVQEALAGEPGLERVAGDATEGTLRYVQRSRLLRFPDTINVKVVPAEGGSAVLIHSRSQIGEGDMGVNLARVERWIGLIKAQLGG